MVIEELDLDLIDAERWIRAKRIMKGDDRSVVIDLWDKYIWKQSLPIPALDYA